MSSSEQKVDSLASHFEAHLFSRMAKAIRIEELQEAGKCCCLTRDRKTTKVDFTSQWISMEKEGTLCVDS